MSGDPGAQFRFPFDEPEGGGASASEPGGRGGAAVWIAPGAMAAEVALLDAVETALERRAADPRSLRRPVRVVVPSLRLREHLNSALLRRRGRALLGVQVQTQRALALEALERAGRAPPLGDALIPVLVRRRAAREPALVSVLELEEGVAVVHASVRDFLDAGLEPGAHAEAADECLAERGATPTDGSGVRAGGGPGVDAGVERARAVVRVAAGVGADLETLGLVHGASLLARARDLLRELGPAALPTDAMWIHGFADATGLAAEWLETLVRVLGARAIVSAPPDPLAQAPAEAPGTASGFAAPLVERLGGLGGSEPVRTGRPPRHAGRPTLESWSAAGEAAELRSVAAQVRALLDAGATPERIGVVARRLEPYRNALHAQFTRLGIPFSAPGVEGPGDLTARRGRALVALLARGERLACDRWLDADVGSGALHPSLRVALHALGARDLGAFAALALEPLVGSRGLALPMRVGSDDEGPLRRPRIASDVLLRAQGAARALLRELEAWPARAPFAAHREALERVLAALGWRGDDTGAERARAALETLTEQVPADLVLSREELSLLVERAWSRAAGREPGGCGAGVQVSPVMAARGRTFEHLFAIGLNRDVFPRPLREDALVPDRLRETLRRSVLPELPVKARGREEERHLFADLLASSPRVVLFHQHAGDDGRERTPSPFLVRLALEDAAVAERRVADPLSGGPLTLYERAVRSGADGVRDRGARADALGEACRGLGVLCRCDADRLARVQGAVLDELEPRSGPGRARLGPYFGFVLPPRPSGEERLHVTRLEGLARCGWQSFLRRELGIEPLPDALETLPALGPQLLGNLVHRVLERIVATAAPEERLELAAALDLGPFPVTWPDPASLRVWLLEEAEGLAREEGIRTSVFARALAARAEPLVMRARELLGLETGPGRFYGAELRGTVELDRPGGGRRRLDFRVDAVDAGPEGLRLTDYKTGRSFTGAAKESTRRRHLGEAIARGEWLQAAAYQQGARQRAGVDRASGRYLLLGDATPDPARELAVGDETPELLEAFRAAADTGLRAFDAGVRPPRLVEVRADKEPDACGWCEVSDACLRGDSGARLRLRGWIGRARADGEEPEDLCHRLYVGGRTGGSGS